MANKFVWSGATGSNDGSSWDNAYTSLMRDWGAEGTFTPATDYIYVRSVHSESSASALTITGSTAEGTTAACRVICVVGDTTGTTPGNLATGASVTTTSNAAISLLEGLYVYGVDFYSSGHVNVAGAATLADCDITLESCRLELTTNSGSYTINIGQGEAGGKVIHLNDVIMDFAHASQGIDIAGHATFTWKGGSVAFDVNSLVVSGGFTNAARALRFVGLDLSILTSSSLFTTPQALEDYLIFMRCLFATSMTLTSGTITVPGQRVESYHCQIGTDADPSYQMEIQDSRGKVSANTAKYRTGGASDGVRSTPISWDFDTTVGSVRGYPGHAFEGPPISAWTTGDGATQHTYRVAFASDASIKDDELWMELEGPNDAATNSLAALKTTRVAPQSTAAAYTTDSGSTWTGTGVTTKQYMQIQYTPDKPGPVTVRVYMAKASDNIYVDPLIQIDPS